MSGPPRKRLAVVVSNGWSVKNFCHTGLLRRLAEQFDLAVIVQPTMVEAMRRETEAFPGGGHRVFALTPLVETGFEKLVRRVQKSIFFSRFRIETELIKRRSVRPFLQRAATAMSAGLSRTPIGAGLLSATEILYRSSEKRDPSPGLFQEFKPDFLLLGHPIDPVEIRFACAAHRFNVPVAGDVLSWDNLTSKGMIPTWFTDVFVWNQTMQDEVLRFYPAYKERDICITGVPRFDFYRLPFPPEYQREAYLRGLGLDPKKRILLFANSASTMFPEQPEVIEHVAKAIESGELPECQLLVRQHPRDIVDIPESAHVKVYRQKLNNADVFNWYPDVADTWGLAAMMRHAAVMMNPASTVTLESAICDVPTINIAYDGNAEKPYEKSVRRYYDYSHQLPLLRFNATTLARSRKELTAMIKRYLENPSLEGQERFNLANSFCAVERGLATDLKANAISNAVLRERP